MKRQTSFPLHFIIFYFFFLLKLLVLPQCSASSKVRRLLFSHESEHYAVIFDAGSTGSRVHVFRFDHNLDLLPIGNDIEYFLAINPGLSSYADDPNAAALSLKPLLDKAEGVVPKDLQPETPLKLGATAGLRLLKGDAAAKILQAVRDLFKNETSLSYKAEWVSVLDGTQEGSYFWVALNYLLGNLGKKYERTIATIDLGGGSVQMTYAISKESASKAPKVANGEPYVLNKSLLGANYHLYVHSYLNYGQLAARKEIFKASGNSSSSPCILGGYNGYYTYNGVAYKASSPRNGSSLKKCKTLTKKALKIKAPCNHKKCTFGGVWNGGGGDGYKNLYASSFFYDYAAMVGIIDPKKPSGRAKPIQYLNAAKLACKTSVKDIKSVFPNIGERNVPYICMDLVYEYALLVNGFGLHPKQEITVVHDVKYRNYIVGAAWPLGCAIDVVSSSS
ncbi:apyrase-like [Nicotiana tomentosiformis]|uniref:Apyrase-like n=1 Tax=Nicotiana tabacum TaxID=4097 RepID=A0A1S3XXM4_TOBAC|nr:apyrase-like [Nicotiana tomentosiformis]XP_016444701.1 PREDICTED: apyrase-like [Nicotiana tabacum]